MAGGGGGSGRLVLKSPSSLPSSERSTSKTRSPYRTVGAAVPPGAVRRNSGVGLAPPAGAVMGIWWGALAPPAATVLTVRTYVVADAGWVDGCVAAGGGWARYFMAR